ncbi:O-antigen ligase family protein [Marivirga arenosa]|uniref:O-antigen ligase family protein n=1 Tax=Marivirga arenosa TaxID=3059076 RepID=A0AA51N853_9BACT|nr:O-antigen ligase family protein [Marivirga sp. ABR2-2]WMN08051.1 O-antigen ligase family protein [Marivirga sp. ABR2-2]
MTFYLIFQLVLIIETGAGLETLFHYNTHYNIAKRFGSHNTYLSLYLVFSVGVYLNKLVKNKKYRLFTLLLIISSVLYIVILASRSQFIALGILLIVSAIIYIFNKRELAKGVIAIFLISGLLFFLMKNVHFLSYRFDKIMEREFNIENIDKRGDKRFYRWKSIYNHIDKNTLFGYGTGDEMENLNTFYQQDNLFSAINKYNAHNEYISTYIRWGWIGLVLLVIFLIYQFSLSIKNKDYLYFVFILIIAHLCLYESIFGVQKGIVFFFFFSSLFLHKYKIQSID